MEKLIRLLSFSLLVIFSIFSTTIQGQDQVWEGTYNSLDYGAFRSTAQTPDGGYATLSTYSLPTETHLSLTKVDESGAPEWIETYDQELGISFTYMTLAHNDEGFIAAFSIEDTISPIIGRATVMKIDFDGNELWTKILLPNIQYSRTWGIIAASDGGYFCMIDYYPTTINDPAIFSLVKLDAQGNVLWTKDLGDTQIFSAYEIIQSTDNKLFLLGNNTQTNERFLLKMDENGIEEWRKNYSSKYATTIYPSANDGGCLIGFRFEIADVLISSITKFNAAGETIWETTLPNNDISDITLSADNHYVLTGKHEEVSIAGAPPSDVFLRKIDASSGQILWTRRFGESISYEKGFTIQTTEDHGFIIGGNYSPDQLSNQLYLIKTDSLGMIDKHHIKGKIFRDENTSCLLDQNESGIANIIVKAEGQKTYYALSDSLGNYSFDVQLGDHNIIIQKPNIYAETCQDTFALSLTTEDTTSIDFGINTSIECPYMQVDITTPRLRRCFSSKYYVNYCNLGTIDGEDAYIEVLLDDYLTYDTSSIPYLSQSGNLFLFDLGTVAPSACGSFTITVTVSCDAELGQVHCTEAYIYPDTICIDPPSDWDGSTITIDAYCTEDSTHIQIKNIGEGNMQNALPYHIIEDQVIMMNGNFQLDSGNSLDISIPAGNSSIYVAQAAQAENHPYLLYDLSLAIAGCNNFMNPLTYYPIEFPLNESANFISIDCQENIGSYDPNDKRGFPIGYGPENYIQNNTTLEYIIRFQNTGTDTAFTVRIIDTIAAHLNPSTIRVGSSSHPYRFDLYGEGVLQFTFDNIMLPDSNVNESASHGFVKFSIQPKVDLPQETIIENNAAIYFDFNAPVITNMTKHTIDHGVIIVANNPSPLAAKNQIKTFPNPARNFVIFEFDPPLNKIARFELFDLAGRTIYQQKITGTQFRFERNGLTQGMYFYKIQTNSGPISSGKIIIQ